MSISPIIGSLFVLQSGCRGGTHPNPHLSNSPHRFPEPKLRILETSCIFPSLPRWPGKVGAVPSNRTRPPASPSAQSIATSVLRHRPWQTCQCAIRMSRTRFTVVPSADGAKLTGTVEDGETYVGGSCATQESASGERGTNKTPSWGCLSGTEKSAVVLLLTRLVGTLKTASREDGREEHGKAF